MAAASASRALRRLRLRPSRVPAIAASAAPAAQWRSAASGSSGSGHFGDSEKEAPFLPKRKSGPPRTADGIPLPEGWREHRSPSRGIFYSHDATGVTQFDFPEGKPSAKQVEEAYQQRVGHKVAQLHPGAQVQMIGLQFQPQLNGKSGTCEGWDPGGKMIRVRLPSGELKAVKPENLRVVQAAAARVKPQRLIGDDKRADTGGAGGTWSTRPQVLGLLGFGAVAFWAARYAWFLSDDAARRAAAAQAEAEAAAQELALAAAALAPLPAGWSECVDPASGKSYYWKEENPTGTTTWTRPKFFKA